MNSGERLSQENTFNGIRQLASTAGYRLVTYQAHGNPLKPV